MDEPFLFSVVMAVYQTDQYLREAIDSLIIQTIGFDNIQVILVDDGSKDHSGRICDEYAEKYPQNIIVIHQENRGVSAARNAGLEKVRGKYVNFLDSDDKLGRDTLRKVHLFFQKHEDEVDVASIPMYFFGKKQGEHSQNRKFRCGKEVLDLHENPYVEQLSSSCCFFRKAAIKGHTFDENLSIAEDAKFVLAVLLSSMKLGLVHKGRYWYRKRSEGEPSAIQSCKDNKKWYIDSIRHYSLWALDEAKKHFGFIPPFVQHSVMYDLQWKLGVMQVPYGLLTEAEESCFRDLLFSVLRQIDDVVIYQQKELTPERKQFALKNKYEKGMDLPCIPMYSTEHEKTDILLRAGETEIARASEMATVLEFISFSETDGTCTVEGYHKLLESDYGPLVPGLEINGHQIECRLVDRSAKDEYSLGMRMIRTIGFKGTFKVGDSLLKIRFALKDGEKTIIRSDLQSGPFFPLSEKYRYAYSSLNKYYITFEKDALSIAGKPAWFRRAGREILLIAEIWKKGLTGGKKAIAGRIIYHLWKPFKRNATWIISDRIMKADDNGEALFRYIMEHKPPRTKIVFAISKKSPDYQRLSKIGKCVDFPSYRHKLSFLFCDFNISSSFDMTQRRPFMQHDYALKDILAHHQYIFLQHGVTKDDMSVKLNRWRINSCGIVTASSTERQSMINDKYGYGKEQIWLTGFPRFDRLYRNEKKKVTVMPTWRNYLMDYSSSSWKLKPSFAGSAYYCFYNTLINDERLINALEKSGYALQFRPHPEIMQSNVCFDRDERVIFIPYDTPYAKTYAESNLVVTDYSSAVFDFAYLRKPIIYCQFDKETFFSNQYIAGYFDYERDGFGEVEYDLESTVDRIIEYVENDCMLKDQYRERIDRFFAYNDQNNCQRVTEKILALSAKG